MKIFCEQLFGDFIYPKCDEESGKDIDRIVVMPQKDNNSEKERSCQEYITQDLLIPEDQSHKERKSCMSGKEEISRECERIEDKVSAFQWRLLHGWPHMRKYNEKGTNNKKYAETFKHKRSSPGAQCQQTDYKNKKSHNAIHEYPIDIYCGNIIENKVVNRIAHISGRVSAGHIIDHKTDCKEKNSPENGD